MNQNKYLQLYFESLGFNACGCLWKKKIESLSVGSETILNAFEIIEIIHTEKQFKVKRYYMYLQGDTTMIYYEQVQLRILYNIIELMYQWEGGDVL